MIMSIQSQHVWQDVPRDRNVAILGKMAISAAISTWKMSVWQSALVF